MPIIKSAIKRMRQTIKRRARNVATKRNLRTALKDFSTEHTPTNFSKAQSEIDKAVKKNLLSKNTAARKKAQLAKIAKETGSKAKTTKRTTVAKTTVKKATTKKVASPKTTAKKTAKKTTE